MRDEQNRVVTEISGGLTGSSTATLSVARDNVFLGSMLVASYAAGAWTYSVSDHLGSPRAVWNASGTKIEDHKYWPYGEDTSATLNQHIAFQDMERNDAVPVYYDHARSQQFNLGRFLSTDVLMGATTDPQSWNRYAYAGNNPLRYLDPDGNEKAPAEALGNVLISIGRQLQASVGNVVATRPAQTASNIATAALGMGIAYAGDQLTAGAETGEAIGSGADPSIAIGNDINRLTNIGAVLTGAGFLFREAATMTTVTHFTDDAGLAAIRADGFLRGGTGTAADTFVTRPSDVRGLGASQVESKLGIGSGKGQNSLTFRVNKTDLRIPAGGPKTTGGAYQRQLNKACSVTNTCIQRTHVDK